MVRQNDETHEDTYRHDRENVELRNAGKFRSVPQVPRFFPQKKGAGGDTDSRNDEQVEQVQSK